MSQAQVKEELKQLIKPFCKPGPRFRRSLTGSEVEDLLSGIYELIQELNYVESEQEG